MPFLPNNAHSILSKALVLQHFKPTLFRSLSTVTTQFSLGHLVFLFPPGLPSSNFFILHVPSILIIFPKPSSLHTLIKTKILGDLSRGHGCLSVSCQCCVLSGRGLCDGPIPLPGESYRVWCVCLETSKMTRRGPE